MKKYLAPAAAVLIYAALFSLSFSPTRDPSGFDIDGFAKIPVLAGGRIKPIDTVARTSLLMIHGKQSLKAGERKLGAVPWLLDVLYRSEKADEMPLFEIDDPDVLGVLRKEQTKTRYYSFKDIFPHFQEIERQVLAAEQVKPEQRSRFQRAILKLQTRLTLYRRLKNTLLFERSQNFSSEIASIKEALAKASKPASLIKEAPKYHFLGLAAEFYPLPDLETGDSRNWLSIGHGILVAIQGGPFNPGIQAFAAMGDAWRQEEASAFNEALKGWQEILQSKMPGALSKAKTEFYFNRFQPFYRAMLLYTAVFLLTFVFWLARGEGLYRTAAALLGFGFLIHTSGLILRMYLQGRPPVTNLYSSAIFVGWVSVVLGIVLERIFRRGLGMLVAATIGFVTLIIAHHLAAEGDTLEMMRAVLDSNLWLATHVTCITIGYGSTFLSGFLGALYVFRRLLDKSWNEESAKTLERMAYGVVCFSAFFSFLGTVLGGIWADQSWGRFWGWDPKENGALLIVLWNIFILHARIGKLAGQRAIMVMCVFGNIVTALSWFGVNMLGIGLHSYGFMDAAFFWLAAFVALNLGIMALGIQREPRERS